MSDCFDDKPTRKMLVECIGTCHENPVTEAMLRQMLRLASEEAPIKPYNDLATLGKALLELYDDLDKRNNLLN